MRKSIKSHIFILLCFIGLATLSSFSFADETTYEIRKLFFDQNGFSWYDAAESSKEAFLVEYNKNKVIEKRNEMLAEQQKNAEENSKRMIKEQKLRMKEDAKRERLRKKDERRRAKEQKRMEQQRKVNEMKRKWAAARANQNR